jgi:glycerol uptake facilitator-like aquaporin
LMLRASNASASTCFFENDAGSALWRRASTEFSGTFFLMLVACASSHAAQQWFQQPAAVVVTSACATSAALVGLILAFGAASGGHFNPLISGLQWIRRERGLSCAAAYVVAQLFGAWAGVSVGNLLMGANDIPHPVASSVDPARWISELIASAGLMIVVFGCSRSGLRETGPIAVGAWLLAAIIAMPSGSYANPAISLAALGSDAPFGLSFPVAASYVLAEILGSLLALAVIAVAYPRGSLASQSKVPPPTLGSDNDTCFR